MYLWLLGYTGGGNRLMPRRFHDRKDAGVQLAARLAAFAGDANTIVLGLPRGGVPVAYEVAMGLRAPLDVFIVRKLGVPGQRELAMGAIASGGVRVLNDEVIQALKLSPSTVEAVAVQEQPELERQQRLYRGEVALPGFAGRTVIVVDDGLATGASMRAAVRALRQSNPRRIVVAVPVGATETCRSLQTDTDEVICLYAPESFYSVSTWYEEFSQTSDDEVRKLLAASRTVS
jgi:putative phosphoribosyl transferase